MPEINNWSFNFDLKDVTAPSKKTVIAPEGYYRGSILSATIDTDHNKDRVKFVVRVSEGEYAGATCKDSMMLPGTTQKDNRVYWRGLFESMGVNPDQLNKQAVNIKDAGSIFVGKTVTFYFKPGNRELGTWNKLLFLNPQVWEMEKQFFTPEPSEEAAAPAAAPTITPAAQSAAPAAQATQAVPAPKAGFASPQSSSDILNMLS